MYTMHEVKVEAVVRNSVSNSIPGEQRKGKRGERFLQQQQPEASMSGGTTYRASAQPESGLFTALTSQCGAC